MSEKHLAPAIDRTGFNCPHCGVRAVQRWGELYNKMIREKGIPWLPNEEDLKKILDDADISGDARAGLEGYIRRRMGSGLHLEKDKTDMFGFSVTNLFLAQCEHCTEISLWMHDKMVYPSSGEIPAHDDLPTETKRTFQEASKILDSSPRAAAALARLAIQQLCTDLDCKEKDLNKQIGELVERGLNPEIQKMLDAVRVIGNNAVHPGTIDLKDDQKTAQFLLTCVNRICQRLITEKREADELYGMLPAGAKEAIEKRDKSSASP